MGSKPGYEIGRDELGLTERDRKVAAGIRAGRKQTQIAEELGISRQRVSEIVKRLKDNRGVDLTVKGGQK